MRPIEMTDAPKSNGSRTGNEFVSAWNMLCKLEQQKEDEWISDLRSKGVKAAHPNDGWNNREEKTLQLGYPAFNDGVSVGDIVAIGSHDEYHLVKISQIKTSEYFPEIIHYHYRSLLR